MIEKQIQSETRALWAYVNFLVWVDGVDTGFVDNAVAEDMLAETYECHNASTAVKLLWRNEALYNLFLLTEGEWWL